MKWFRLYEDVLNNPKVQSLEPAVFKFWVNLLCVTSQVTSHGDGALPSRDKLAFYMRVSVEEVEKNMALLIEKRLVDTEPTLLPQHWHERQYKSDSSTERTRKYREKIRTNSSQKCDVTQNVTVTRGVTAPDTDTDTDIKENNKKKKLVSAEYKKNLADAFEKFWEVYPRREGGKAKTQKIFESIVKNRGTKIVQAVFDGLEKQLPELLSREKKFRPLPSTWLNQERWTDEANVAERSEDKW